MRLIDTLCTESRSGSNKRILTHFELVSRARHRCDDENEILLVKRDFFKVSTSGIMYDSNTNLIGSSTFYYSKCEFHSRILFMRINIYKALKCRKFYYITIVTLLTTCLFDSAENCLRVTENIFSDLPSHVEERDVYVLWR